MVTSSRQKWQVEGRRWYDWEIVRKGGEWNGQMIESQTADGSKD